MSQLSPSTLELIKASVPVLQEHGEALTTLFYRRMFENNPEVKAFFNPAHQVSGQQPRALAGAVLAYAMHIDKLSALGPAVELIAHKHASLGIQAEHYPIVGSNLLGAIAELLGEAATPELLAAWGEAYGLLAQVFIAREGELYQEHQARYGWEGLRSFVVKRRQVESEEITSFYLEPADKESCGAHRPGQYLTLRGPGQGAETTLRNYSISSSPSASGFRISVKKEQGDQDHPQGWFSHWLHNDVQEGDTLEVGPPCGDFWLDTQAQASRPLVFLAGGVGATPLLSMLHAACEADTARDIYWVQAARHGGVHAFQAEVQALARRNPRLKLHTLYDQPRPEDRADHTGRVDLALLKEIAPGPDADFYFCGPKGFMQAVHQALVAWEVPAAQRRYEFFGPLEVLG